MGGDLPTLATEISPYMTAAIGAYGGAVLANVKDQAADATVGLGRRLLQRIFGTRDHAEQLPQTVADLAADPDDPDFQAALRVAIRKELAKDAVLAEEVRKLLAGSAGIKASGDRSIAAHTISGIASTGDNATLAR